MNIIVDRFISDNDSTISRIMVNGQFICFGLEDEFRVNKVPGETRIPAGAYKVILRKEGSHHLRYKAKFPNMHKGMLWISNVPNFKWVLIHIGNTDADTSGCLLVGSQAITDPGDMKVIGSTIAYRKLYPMVVDSAENESLSITFLDNDRLSAYGNPIRVNEPSHEYEISTPLSDEEKDELFNHNSIERNKMNVQAGSLVGALLDELIRNADTYIRLTNPVEGGYKIDYELVQGNKYVISILANALGFKSVSETTLEVFSHE
jgi:hypothetical protein